MRIIYLIHCQKIDIVVGGDHGQGKFRSVGKFIMRDKKELIKIHM